jgi:hypothetical protein
MRLALRLTSVLLSLVRIVEILALAGLLCGCNLCGNKIGYEEKSPSGKLKAVVFERDCGATTGFTTHVSILPNNDTLQNQPGNSFIGKGDLSIRLKWESDGKLVLTYPQGAQIDLKQDTENGVSVRYEASP